MRDVSCQSCHLLNSLSEDMICNVCGYDNNGSSGSLFKSIQMLNPNIVIIYSDCFHNFSEGGKELAKIFPEINESEKMTRRGDTNKLGRYSKAYIWDNRGNSLLVLIAYVRYRSNDELDYSALRDIIDSLSNNFYDKHILMQYDKEEREELDSILNEIDGDVRLTVV